VNSARAHGIGCGSRLRLLEQITFVPELNC
jgi:hypothetical protein